MSLLFGFVEVLEGCTFTLKTCQAAASSSQRLVICPTRPGSLPWAAGYAEVDTPKTSNVHVPPKRKHVEVDRSSIILQHCLAVLCWLIREAFPKNNARIASAVQLKLPPALHTIWATFVTFKKVSKSIWVRRPPLPPLCRTTIWVTFSLLKMCQNQFGEGPKEKVFFFFFQGRLPLLR